MFVDPTCLSTNFGFVLLGLQTIFSVDLTVVFIGSTFYEPTVYFTVKLTVAKL